MCKWLRESNRWKHLACAIPEGLLLTILFAAGCGFGMEVKDCHYDPRNAGLPIYKWHWDNFDWLDFLATCIGGLIGQTIQLVIILLIAK